MAVVQLVITGEFTDPANDQVIRDVITVPVTVPDPPAFSGQPENPGSGGPL
jgi:hypothetical protein